MAHTSTLITAPGETLADALYDLTKIAEATYRAAPFRAGVTTVRRPDRTVVASYADPSLEPGQYLDEPMIGFYPGTSLVEDVRPFDAGYRDR